jgi:predicted metal-dependent hydrolase
MLPFDAPPDEVPAAARTDDAVPVEVVRSTRRRKTVQARMIDGRLRIHMPAHLSAAEEEHWVREMSRRFGRHRSAAQIDLPARARRLARQLDLPLPRGIRWVANQSARWGSCTPATGQIRLSDRLSAFPTWVIDYVIVHELAHLVVPSHGPAFRAVEHRYERAERAIGFLIAKGMAPHDTDAEGASEDPVA